MEFQKYPKIMNHYHNKQLQEHLEYNPSCKDALYVCQIKYDGSNISFCFTPNEEMRIAKRSGLIGKYDNFNGVLDIIDQYQEVIDHFQSVANFGDFNIILYGEIFGKGIQNRINYGDGKYIRFFDIRMNDKKLTFEEIQDNFIWDIIKPYWVEHVGSTFTLDQALQVEVPEGHEGIVIKPYNRVESTDRLLYIKKKNPEFEEKMKSNKSKKKQKEVDPEVEHLKELFLEYINHNRLKSVFSKEGEISKPEQIGEYIKLVMADAREDFLSDNDLSNSDRGKMNEVYKSANREVVKLLKEYL